MSYNVRDDNATFGPNAAIEMPNGAGQSTIAKIQMMEPVIFNAPTATQFAGSSTYYTIFIAPPSPSTATGLLNLGGSFLVSGLTVYYTTAASAAAQFYCEICAAGTAAGSGLNVIGASTGTGYYSLATALTANTPASLPLSANIDNLIIPANGRVNIYATTQATTSLVNFTVALYLIRM